MRYSQADKRIIDYGGMGVVSVYMRYTCADLEVLTVLGIYRSIYKPTEFCLLKILRAAPFYLYPLLLSALQTFFPVTPLTFTPLLITCVSTAESPNQRLRIHDCQVNDFTQGV